MLSIIAAIGKNRELGYQNKLLWNLPDDLKHFKKITEGHTVIMGRKTFESIGRPLPNRKNIIITRDDDFQADSCEIAHSLDSAIQIAQQHCNPERSEAKSKDLVQGDCQDSSSRSVGTQNDKRCEIFIIGGAQIYEQALPFCDKLYLTLVDDSHEADVYFPDYSEFKNISIIEKKEYNGIKYKWVELTKC
jgi:dihydrofolate reductase